MKRWLFCVLPMVMILGLLVGCGAKPDTKENVETTEAEQKGVTDGYWVVEKMVMEGMEFEGEELKNTFGEVENILAMVFNEDGSYDGVYMDEFIKGTYTDNNGTLETEMLELKAKGECSGETLVLTLDDKYVYTGAMNQVSNTTSTPNGSSSSVTATCASFVTTTIPVYGYETIEHSSDLLYGTICYKSTKTRTANTQTKWSSYNDTSLLNNGWSYTGNKKVAN